MYRRISVLIVGLALVSVVRSEENLKCYMCTSLTHTGCDKDPQASNILPVECTLNHMEEWEQKMKDHQIFGSMPAIFEVDNSQHHPVAVPMACAKMVIKVNLKEVVIRTCQTAKTETLDPCRAISGKLPGSISSLEQCELCSQDACNSSIQISPTIFLTLLSTLGAMLLGGLFNSA
ncbi:UPAR/Ly6 domain-containing protein CG9338 [Xylocopa sonorina]|uniref:UPAR/Ly6 domain-containing protein CG9338 n=1 Tax=Xylocopa sonorina TaxID=1818115 RepID=UPI00403ABF19